MLGRVSVSLADLETKCSVHARGARFTIKDSREFKVGTADIVVEAHRPVSGDEVTTETRRKVVIDWRSVFFFFF